MKFSAPILVPLLLLCPFLAAQPHIDSREVGSPINSPVNSPTQAAPLAIAWYPTWELGLAEAKRSGRPILLQSAAPQCHGVPGMW